MKTKIYFFALLMIATINKISGQTIPFTFIKSCTTFDRAGLTEDLTKKKFYVAQESMKGTASKAMEGATFYCNEKERELGNAEIDILSIVNGDKKICEFTFKKGNKHDYGKNFGEIYNQMKSVLNKTASIQSKKFGEVETFTKNGIYYYTFKVNEVPMIVVASYKVDAEYF